MEDLLESLLVPRVLVHLRTEADLGLVQHVYDPFLAGARSDGLKILEPREVIDELREALHLEWVYCSGRGV